MTDNGTKKIKTRIEQQYDIKTREYPATKEKFSSKKKIKSGMRRFNRGGKV